MVVGRTKARLDVGTHRIESREICFLRQIADAGARMREAFAPIGLGEIGGNLQKRRLARAIAADEANAIARRDGQFRAFEQRRAAERQVNIFECQKRRCHAGTS